MSGVRRFAWIYAVVLVLTCCAWAPGLRGQEKPKSEQSPAKKSSGEGSTGQKSSNKPAVERPRGPAQELAHETREAAGEEEDETAEFKQSASVRLISKWTGLSLRRAYWLSFLTNFIVIAAVIVWAARKYLPGAFRERTAAIQKAMQEAQKSSEEARRRLSDIETRLMKLDVEIGMMRDAAESEAAAEEARIQAAAKADAAKIIESAEQEIAAAVKAARRELTTYTAELAVSLAQKQIRVNPATDQALVKSFAVQLSAASGDGSDAGRER